MVKSNPINLALNKVIYLYVRKIKKNILDNLTRNKWQQMTI